MLRLDGKTALVTGIGSPADGLGNGKAIAMLLARQGAQVMGIDRDATAAEATVQAIRAEGGACQFAVGDITDEMVVENWVASCHEQQGKIDILVNNVGASEPGGPLEMPPAVWQAQLELNLTSAYLMTRAVIPHMKQAGGGAIVSIASVAGQRYIGKPQIAYSTAKAALLQFSRATAIIHARDGIRLNCVVPGLMHTPLVTRLAAKYAGGDEAGFIAERNEAVPLGKMGDAMDVAHAVLFLVADEAKHVTATELVVDGGLTAATRGTIPQP